MHTVCVHHCIFEMVIESKFTCFSKKPPFTASKKRFQTTNIKFLDQKYILCNDVMVVSDYMKRRKMKCRQNNLLITSGSGFSLSF